MSAAATDVVRSRLRALGFDQVRFASIPGTDLGSGLRDWLEAGHHADMAWMERTRAKREAPELVLAGARSMIVLGVNYGERAAVRMPTSDPSMAVEIVAGSQSPAPVWARYALHEDYHDTMRAGLVAAGKTIEEVCGVGTDDYRYYVDTGPVLERAWAAQSGLGFVGKNAMLISREFGNWLFLAAILTRVEFAPDPPIRKRFAATGTGDGGVGLLCGKCTRCLDACPTQAFAAPGVVDARRCISYQTIENKGVIPRELRVGIGLRIYGCDVCLEVCPWNRFAQDGRRVLLTARAELKDLSLVEVLALTPERFAAVFRKTAIKRVKLAGLLRNACIVAGNTGDPAVVPALLALAKNHASPLVRAHAVWAVYRLGAGAGLADARASETEPTVLAEYAAEE